MNLETLPPPEPLGREPPEDQSLDRSKPSQDCHRPYLHLSQTVYGQSTDFSGVLHPHQQPIRHQSSRAGPRRSSGSGKWADRRRSTPAPARNKHTPRIQAGQIGGHGGVRSTKRRKMIIPVRCFTCGKVIGNKWETYLHLLQADFSEG